MNQRRHCEQERYSENTSICLHSTNSFSHLADRRIPDRSAAVTGVNRTPLKSYGPEVAAQQTALFILRQAGFRSGQTAGRPEGSYLRRLRRRL